MLSLGFITVVDTMKLIDIRARDGSRHFAVLPHTAAWEAVRDHAPRLPEARVINFIDERIAQPWLDFTFQGHHFVIHCRHNEIHLTVRDPLCSDLILFQVASHFGELLGEAG